MTNKQSQSVREQVLKGITEGNIAPKPRWYFVLRNVAVWAVGFVFLLVSAVVFSMILLAFTHNVLDVHRALGGGAFGRHLVTSFPYIWLLSLIAFVWIIELAVRQTKQGYRYATWKIVVGVSIASVIVGWGFHAIGVSSLTDYQLGAVAPRYVTIEERQDRMVRNAAGGHLLGYVVNANKYSLIIENPMAQTRWIVDISAAEIKDSSVLAKNARIVIKGKVSGDNRFIADKVIPLQKFKKHYPKSRQQDYLR